MLGAVLLSVAGAVAVADSSKKVDRERSAEPGGAGTAKVARVSSRQRARLAAFGRAAGLGDRLPPAARENIERAAQYGENPALARKVLTMASGHAIYMVPAANDLVGIYDEMGGGGVTDLAHIEAGESYGVDICAPKLAQGWVRYYGELPSDASDVVIVARDGSQQAPLLGENTWALEVRVTPEARLPKELRFRSAGASRTVTLETPSDLSGRCRRGG